MTVPSRSASNSAVEVSASGRRRRFTVDDKTRIVQEAARAKRGRSGGSRSRARTLSRWRGCSARTTSCVSNSRAPSW